MLTIIEHFESDTCFFLTKGARTILYQAAVRAEGLNPEQEARFTDHLLRYLMNLREDKEGSPSSLPPAIALKPTTAIHNLTTPHWGSFYRWVGSTWAADFKKGQVRVGSLEYYRAIESGLARDPQEGFATLFCGPDEDCTAVSLVAGFEHFILSGSAGVSSADRYGDVLFEIEDVRAFGDTLAEALGAIGWDLRTVRYEPRRSLKSSDRLPVPLEDDLSAFMRANFDALWVAALEASLFLKQSVPFEEEREVRFVFDMESRTAKVRTVSEPALAQFILQHS